MTEFDLSPEEIMQELSYDVDNLPIEEILDKAEVYANNNNLGELDE